VIHSPFRELPTLAREGARIVRWNRLGEHVLLWLGCSVGFGHLAARCTLLLFGAFSANHPHMTGRAGRDRTALLVLLVLLVVVVVVLEETSAVLVVLVLVLLM
jgi:hypothetical protein